MSDPSIILEKLLDIKRLDVDPLRGRLFTYIYETGDVQLKKLASKAIELFTDTNALDPTVFKSALFFEKEVVSFAKSLVHAGDSVVGTATYGGTESIMLAVKAARWVYRRTRGAGGVPEVVLPITGHPSIRKAAHYLDMRTIEVPVDPETKKADVEAVKEAVSSRTALIVLSAPNFPYGVIDPIREIAEYASDKSVPVHVDACVGGFILPFMEELGERVEPFDFRVEGVTSLSMDAHKYGYTPKGVSVVLFGDEEFKKGTIFVDLKWPGYPLINTTVLSSRSAAPLAAAWAVFNYLGRKGYLDMTRRVLSARNKLYGGMRRLGFYSVAPLESPLLSMALDDESEVFKFHANMSLRGWVIGLQPKLEGVAPYNIHLTVSPIHDKVAEEYLRDAKESIEGPPPEELVKAYELLERDPLSAASLIGETPLDAIIIAKILESIPGELAEEIARQLTVEVFK
ncbi:MAG: aspartate aminotransferase family protein [Desulfurococcales archaeon]|nr:aspartate aminotransferase family protein [Desulfurococcales archaeon]